MADFPTSRRARLIDVAKLAGVSVQTVSNVANAKVAEMTPETRERVEEAMRKLHYVPNVQARSLRSQRTSTLAFLLLDPDPRYLADPMTDLLISGVGAVARERGYMVLLHAAQPYEMDEGLFLPIRQNRADGALLLLSGEKDVRRQYVEAAKTMTSDRLVVFEDVDDPTINTVTADNRDGAYRMTNYLLGAGHKRIGFLGTSTPWPMVEERFDGYLAALANAGIACDDRICKFEGEWNASNGEQLTNQLCDEPEPPTALLAGNDLMAVGAIKALKQRGIKVPQEFAVVGFDDFAFAEHVEPALTTVRIPGFEMGHRAATVLIDSIEGKSTKPSNDRLPVELIMRSSA